MREGPCLTRPSSTMSTGRFPHTALLVFSGFTFGKFVPWYYSFFKPWGRSSHSSSSNVLGPTTITKDSATDSQGQHFLNLNFGKKSQWGAGVPISVSITADVPDANNQLITTSSSTLVHSCSYYVGMTCSKTFVPAGVSIPLSIVVSRIDGSHPLHAIPHTQSVIGAVARKRKCDVSDFDLVSSAAAPLSLEIPTSAQIGGGEYSITATT